MKRETIFEKIQQIFRDIFDNQTLCISDETTSNDIEDWDSLNHINLIVSMEKTFNLKFTLMEVQVLKNVGEMVDLIKKKIAL